MDTLKESQSDTTTQADTPSAISICFIDLPTADKATFERVITFCAARGQHFEISDSVDADVLITNDETASIESAIAQQDGNMLLVVSNDQNCEAGDIQLQRPLLVTRVMRTMETLSKRIGPRKKSTISAKPTPATVAPVTETKPAPSTATVTPESSANVQKSYLALVIDDSAAIRKQLEIELRTSGMQSDFAESGEEALEKIADKEYDLIFLDIMMPGIDGYETCGQIRKDPRYKKTPVIMLSGKTSPLDEVKGVLAGASTYLTKPVKHQHFQDVTERITRWLNEFGKNS